MRADTGSARRRLALAGALAAAALASAGCKVLNAPLLAIHNVAGLHFKTRAVDIAPFYTPLGRLGWSARGRVWIEPEPGGEAVLVPDPRTGDDMLKTDCPVMTRDGARLYFLSGVEQHASEGGHNDHVWQVYSMAAGGEDVRRESRSRRKEHWLTLSSDGSHLAFVRRTEFEAWALDGPAWGRADVIVAALDAPRTADDALADASVTGPLFDEYFGVALAPDGSELAFAARNGDEPFCIRRLDLATEGAEPVLWIEGATLPVWSPDGGALWYAARAAASEEERYDLWRLPLAEGGVAAEPLGLDLWEPRHLALSPDGGRVAVAVFEDVGRIGDYVLYELDLAAHTRREVARVEWRNPHMWKPLDYVRPVYF